MEGAICGAITVIFILKLLSKTQKLNKEKPDETTKSLRKKSEPKASFCL
jgi:hypothetical protein